MGKLIFPVKEMAEAPLDGNTYVRKDGAWSEYSITIDNVVTQENITYPTTWEAGITWFEGTIDISSYGISINSTDSWSLIPTPTSSVEYDAVLEAAVVKVALDNSTTIRIYANTENLVEFPVTLEIIRDGGGVV